MRHALSNIIILLMALGLLAACARSIPAPVVYGKSNTAAPATATAAPTAAAIGAGGYLVAADETLYGIARRSGVALRDLITANNLAPPYRLNKGQRLTIPAVRYHAVSAGETLYGISRQHRVSVYALARVNRVQAPYNIRPGQKLRLPASAAVIAKTAKNQAAPKPRSKRKLHKPVIKRAPKRAGVRFAWPVRGPTCWSPTSTPRDRTSPTPSPATSACGPPSSPSTCATRARSRRWWPRPPASSAASTCW